jgi:bifunctional DNase/RNase
MFVLSHLEMLTTGENGNAIAIIKDNKLDNRIKVGINFEEAAKISIVTIGKGDELPLDTTQQLIKKLNLTIEEIRFIQKREDLVTVDMLLKGDKKIVISPTPGEAIRYAMLENIDILVEDTLFPSNSKKKKSLGERIREIDVEDFGSFTIG